MLLLSLCVTVIYWHERDVKYANGFSICNLHIVIMLALPQSPLRRPPLRNEQSSSSSLRGLEMVMPNILPSSRSFQDSTSQDMDTDKPLPPTPPRRKASSVYSSGHDNLIDAYLGLVTRDDGNPSDIYLQPVRYSSSSPQISTGKAFKTSAYQQLQEPLSAPLPFQREAALNPRPKPITQISSDHRWPKQSPTLSERFAQETKVVDHITVERRFDAQRAVPPPRLPTPPGFKAVLYDAEQKRRPQPSSRQSTEAIDRSLVPPPLSLRKTQLSDDVESSHFSLSTSGSDDGSLHTGLRHSVRAYARKALHFHKTTPEEKETKRVMSVASAKYPLMDPSSSTRRPSKFGSLSSERRASIQQGLSNVYHGVAKISTWNPIPSSNKKKRDTIPRELRSPAIPITPYQQLGPKAWEPAPKSPKSPKQMKKAPKAKAPFAILSSSKREAKGPDTPYPHPERQSQDGSSRGKKPKLKRTASEKRRDELKSKIVIVKAADQHLDGKITHWM